AWMFPMALSRDFQALKSALAEASLDCFALAARLSFQKSGLWDSCSIWLTNDVFNSTSKIPPVIGDAGRKLLDFFFKFTAQHDFPFNGRSGQIRAARPPNFRVRRALDRMR